MRTRLVPLLAFAALVGANATPAPAAVGAGHSAWFWGNPLPQGRTLLAVAAAGSTVYATGYYGTILRSDDGGASWRGLRSVVDQYLDHVRVLSPRSFVAAGGCALVRSDDGGATIQRLRYERCRGVAGDVDAIAFPRSAVGYVVDDRQRVLRTGDGGASFRRVGRIRELLGTNDAWFTGPDTGVAVGLDRMDRGTIERTTDGGRTWRRVAHASSNLWGVVFATDRVGYASGDGFVLRTSDGGATWQERPAPGITHIGRISCGDAQHCAAESYFRTVYTDDGFATTAYAVDDFGFDRERHDVAFSSPTHAVLVGDRGSMGLSRDGGATFRSIGYDPETEVRSSLRASSPTHAWFSGSYRNVLETRDGGATWTVLEVPSGYDVTSSWFAGGGIGYAATGYGSVLFGTEDGGSSWSRRAVNLAGRSEIGQIWSSRDGATVLASAVDGLLRSSDGGRHFTHVASAALRRWSYWGLSQVGRRLVAYGAAGIATSRDEGRHWRAVRPPPGRAALASVSFPTARTAFALTADRRLWHTRDRGRRWRELLSLGRAPKLTVISFWDARHGWVGPTTARDEEVSGWLLRTSDGGETWRPQAVDRSPINGGGVVATSRSGGIALSGQENVFFTHSGGEHGARSHLTLSARAARRGASTDVRLAGTLRPRGAGRRVWLSMRPARSNLWRHVYLITRPDGTFRTRWTIHTSTYFVAQWPGDATHRGAGTRAVGVRVLEG